MDNDSYKFELTPHKFTHMRKYKHKCGTVFNDKVIFLLF